MAHETRIVTEALLRQVVSLDRSVVDVVEAAFGLVAARCDGR